MWKLWYDVGRGGLMILLEGKELKERILVDLKDKVSQLERKPTLAVISTKVDSVSQLYIRSKKKMCEQVGFDYRYFDCSDLGEDEIISKISELNGYDDVDGILLQLPVREDLHDVKLIESIDYFKDIDGITDRSMGMLIHQNPYLCSCTALGILYLLEHYSISVSGKNVVILGRSRLVGKPLASMFLNLDATVTLCHSKTKNLQKYTCEADILVVAVGKVKFIKSNMVSENCVVIDVGIHKVDGGLVGDVDFEGVKDKVLAITPVPGGVGPMTVAMLANNLYQAYIRKNESSIEKVN